MKAQITVTMDNAAFADEPATDLARILRELTNEIEADGVYATRLRDINGNTVGAFTVEGGA